MIRLNLDAAKPRWVEIAPGVRLHVLPLTSEVILRAQRAPELRDLVGEDVEAAASDPGVALAVAKLIARAVVTDWEGVGDASGRAVPVTPEGLSALLDIPAAYQVFEREVIAPAMLLEQEKNVSAPSANGGSARARPTAAAAKKPARTARRK